MPENVSTMFPKGLLLWAGHRGGGVKKTFVNSSGCPKDQIIRTNLLDKIDVWIDAIVQPDDSVHRALLMIGGPGNGKTEAVEYFIENFDDKLNARGTLLEKCKSGFTPAPGKLSPRKVIIDLHDIPGAEKLKYKCLEIVQDATIDDPKIIGASPEQLLISDLNNVNKDSELLYISCVNRGILSQTLDEVGVSAVNESTKNMLECILSAVTLSPEQPSCWPLYGYPQVAVWPMDIESLVDQTVYKDGITPAHHIFTRALDHRLWISVTDCPAGKLCPFHANLDLLSNEIYLGNLVKILRRYEIASGKRWTFRELFSLVPQLLVGHENDFKLKGKEVDPCDWAAFQLNVINTSNDAYEKTKAKFLLSSKIYCHALFPRWPSLRAVKDECKQVLKKDPFNDDNANDLFRLLGSFRKDESTSIHGLIKGQFGVLLDPVEVSGSVVLVGEDFSADNLEEMFSYSIEQGYSEIRKSLTDVERTFMDWLVCVEKQVGADAAKGNKNYARLYDEVRKNLQVFACRMMKRSLAVKKGITKDNSYLERYAKAIEQEIELKTARKQFSELIHEGSRFPISLATTYGQPVPHSDHDAVLYTHMVKVSSMITPKSKQHAISSLPYLKIKDHAIPLTYPLFKALVQHREGLMPASIPTDTLALIEGTRSRMAGEILRDIDGLDDAILSIGNNRFSIIIDNNRIKVEEQTK